MLWYFSNSDRTQNSILTLRLSGDAARSDDQRTVRLEERVAHLYDELRSPLYRYLLCMRVLPEEAEEVIQESFLRLYKHLHAQGAEDILRGWIFRVAHNVADGQVLNEILH